jgi:hypothetical protein
LFCKIVYNPLYFRNSFANDNYPPNRGGFGGGDGFVQQPIQGNNYAQQGYEGTIVV